MYLNTEVVQIPRGDLCQDFAAKCAASRVEHLSRNHIPLTVNQLLLIDVRIQDVLVRPQNLHDRMVLGHKQVILVREFHDPLLLEVAAVVRRIHLALLRRFVGTCLSLKQGDRVWVVRLGKRSDCKFVAMASGLVRRDTRQTHPKVNWKIVLVLKTHDLVQHGILQARGSQSNVRHVVKHVRYTENLTNLGIVRRPQGRVRSGLCKLLQATCNVHTQSSFDKVTFVTQGIHTGQTHALK